MDLHLCSLPGPALDIILHKLPHADRLRLAGTCRQLRQLCANAVHTVALGQEDLEDWPDQALNTFKRAHQLLLREFSFAPGLLELSCTAGDLLQQLRSLQVINPMWLEADALLQLASSCPHLTQLRVTGSWGHGSSTNMHHRLPQRLQHLALQHSGVNAAQLLALLSAVPCSNDPPNDEHTPGGGEPLTATPGAISDSCQLPQLPPWCQALNSSSSGDARAAADSSSGASTWVVDAPQPALPHLTALDLTACPQLGASLAFLGLCPSLLSLCLHSCFKLTDATLEHLHQVLHSEGDEAGFEGSSLNGNQQGSAPSAAAAAAPPSSSTLQRLDVSYTRVKDGGMAPLAAALPHLCELGLNGCNVGDNGLQHLLRLRHLTALHIKHCHRVTEEGIQGLSVLSDLRSLSHGYTSMIEANEVAALIAAQFKTLTALDLLSMELTDVGLASLGRLAQLSALKLYQASVSDEALALLGGQPAGAGLTSLVLYGTGLVRGLACLGSLTALRQLQLGRLCDLSAPMATALAELTAVQSLTNLTLERMDGLTVQSLQWVMRGCPDLQLLRVRGCGGVCEEDMEEVAQQAAGACGSSASVWWAAAPSCDTDDEEEGWQMLAP